MSIQRVTVEHTYGTSGGPGINVWHYRSVNEAPDSVELEAVSDALANFYSAIRSYFPSVSTFRLQEQSLNVETSEVLAIPTFTITGNAGLPGYLPVATALVLNWRTTNVSRSGRGRSFFGPLALNNALDANGTPTSGLLTAFQNAGQNLITAFEGNFDGAMGVYSPTQNIIRDFVSCYARDQFAVLRSRRD